MFISVHYVIPHLKMFCGDTVQESAMPPSTPNKIFWMNPDYVFDMVKQKINKSCTVIVQSL